MSEEQTPDWRDSLPEELRDAPYFRNAESVAQVRADIDGAAFWQGNSILKPGADASEEAKATNISKLKELYPNLVDPDSEDIYSRLGKPEEASKYSMPDGVTMDEAEVTALKNVAFEANMTDKQFTAYLKSLNTARATGAEMETQQLTEQAEALRGEWGAATEAYKAEVGRFLQNDPNTPDVYKAKFEAGTLTAAEFKWLHGIAKSGDESSEVSGQPNGEAAVMSIVEAQASASEIRARMIGMRNTDPMYAHLQSKLIEFERLSMAG